MSTVVAEMQGEQCILFENISWETYEALLKELGERQVRLTYDNGDLQIMTLSLGHENTGGFIGRLIETLTLELDIPLRNGGSTTLKRKLKKKGLEPDECYWIRNEARMRGKKEFKPRRDPPPDLAVEVDVTHSSLDRMPIYAALKVPEIWRYDGGRLRVYWLSNGDYQEKKQSAAFPFLPLEKVEEFIRQSDDQDETTLMRAFVRWIRSDLLPTYAGANKPGRRNGKK